MMNRNFYFGLAVAIPAIILPFMATAQTMQQTITIQNGQVVTGPAAAAAGAAPLSEEQKLMFEAPKHVISHDYKKAEMIYSQVLSINSGNIDAYLQRAFVRRELGDAAGVDADARLVVTLSNNALQNDPRNATMFFDRGQGFRLLKQFDQARKDIQGAIQLSGNTTWDTDLKAIDLEEKMSQ